MQANGTKSTCLRCNKISNPHYMLCLVTSISKNKAVFQQNIYVGPLVYMQEILDFVLEKSYDFTT